MTFFRLSQRLQRERQGKRGKWKIELLYSMFGMGFMYVRGAQERLTLPQNVSYHNSNLREVIKQLALRVSRQSPG